MHPNLEFPSIFYIEPTNDCNLSCIMCPRRKITRKIGYMSFELFRKVVDQLFGRKIAALSLHLFGEPLLHPDIVDMVKYAKSKGLPNVRFATNATALNDSLISGLIASELDSLTVSMDFSIVKRYCPAVKDEYSMNLDNNILKLIKLKDKASLKKPKVYMQIIDMLSTHNLLDNFVKKWEGVADKVVISKEMSWADDGSVSQEKNSSTRAICINQLTQGVVQWNGNVTSCCTSADNFTDNNEFLGNVTNESLKEIFQGKKRKRLIGEQLNGNYDLVPSCKQCSDRGRYVYIP